MQLRFYKVEVKGESVKACGLLALVPDRRWEGCKDMLVIHLPTGKKLANFRNQRVAKVALLQVLNLDLDWNFFNPKETPISMEDWGKLRRIVFEHGGS